MVYLTELLVVMTAGLKIVRILLYDTPYMDTSAYRRRHVSRASFSLQESDGVVFSMHWGAVLLKHKKSSQDNLRMFGSD